MKIDLHKKIASSLDVETEQLVLDVEKCTKCVDMDILIGQIKDKMCVSNREKKVRLLTLAPESWTIKKTSEELHVTEYMVKRARELKKSKGILADPEKKKGFTIDDNIVENVIKMYESDEYSRMCPGKKDFVTVKINGVKQKKQKRLLLLKLKEIFIEFKKVYPDAKISFSKFCELRPKWCVNVNSRGMHSVCVCTYHQNVKLLLPAIPVKCEYVELMKHCVCSIDSRDCMLHMCTNCPGKAFLYEILCDYFNVEGFELEEDTISYKQWVSTDRSSLLTIQSTVSEFIENASCMIYDLCSHHYIKEAQSSYL